MFVFNGNVAIVGITVFVMLVSRNGNVIITVMAFVGITVMVLIVLWVLWKW